MNVTSTKQDRQFAESFIPIGEQLRASGFTDWEIVRIFRKQDKARRRQQADKASLYSGIGETILGVAEAFRVKTTNRIEIRYFDLLKSKELYLPAGLPLRCSRRSGI